MDFINNIPELKANSFIEFDIIKYNVLVQKNARINITTINKHYHIVVKSPIDT